MLLARVGMLGSGWVGRAEGRILCGCGTLKYPRSQCVRNNGEQRNKRTDGGKKSAPLLLLTVVAGPVPFCCVANNRARALAVKGAR